MKIILILALSSFFCLIAQPARAVEASATAAELYLAENLLILILAPLFFALVLTLLFLLLKIIPSMNTAQKQLTAQKQIIGDSHIKVLREELVKESRIETDA